MTARPAPAHSSTTTAYAMGSLVRHLADHGADEATLTAVTTAAGHVTAALAADRTHEYRQESDR